VNTPEQSAALGKAAREEAPRSSHVEWDPVADRADPVELQERQAAGRLPELVPIRYGRMLASPFNFFRGAADIMAADLASTPTTGQRVQLCGDAHLSNFGAFASPERELVFDINDFDETLPGPWEWDVKRLAASMAVAGRDRGFGESARRTITQASVREYRTAMREFAAMGELDIWYARMAVGDITRLARSELDSKQVRKLEASAVKAQAKDSLRALAQLTETVNGEPRIVSDPPLVVPIAEVFPGMEGKNRDAALRQIMEEYRRTLPPDRRHLLSRYRHVDTARKVVGVGSVGTRSWIVLMMGRDGGDPLFLQVKEAGPSVLEPFAGPSEFESSGERVVQGQRLMQASSDILLGWLAGVGEGDAHDYYVRQLWDWKRSADIESMSKRGLAAYGRFCGWTLARAHARSGDRIAIAAYLGSGAAFDQALAEFAERYADQNEEDYGALLKAVRSGRIEAHPVPPE
jgi:uncharacterized protein (DUF2252 family)